MASTMIGVMPAGYGTTIAPNNSPPVDPGMVPVLSVGAAPPPKELTATAGVMPESPSCFALFGASDTCLSFAPIGKFTAVAIVAAISLLFFRRK